MQYEVSPPLQNVDVVDQSPELSLRSPLEALARLEVALQLLLARGARGAGSVLLGRGEECTDEGGNGSELHHDERRGRWGL